MSDWPTARLADLAHIDIGGTPSRAISALWAKKPDGHPWISIADLKGKYVQETKEHISSLGVESSNVKLIPEHTTVMSFKLTVGRTAITAREMYCNEAIAIFRPKDDRLNEKWLYHVLPSVAGRVVTDTAVKGATLNKAKLAEMTLRLPAAAEQAKIAEILDTCDAVIQKTETLIDNLKAIKQGLLHDLLTRGIDANGRLRPPQTEAPHLYKESPLGWIPKDWAMRRGAEVCEEVVVGIVIRPTQYYKPEGVPVLRSANVRENRLELTELAYMDERDHRFLSKSSVRPGDVLTVRTGYPGTSCVVDAGVPEANCVDILISRPSRALDSGFWSRWINSDRGKAQVLAAQGGLAQQHFNVGDLQRLMIALPSLVEQRAIDMRLQGVDSWLEAERQYLATSMDLKSALMDDLLTGRVRVTPLLAKQPTERSA